VATGEADAVLALEQMAPALVVEVATRMAMPAQAKMSKRGVSKVPLQFG
jgi:hypothetical protein